MPVGELEYWLSGLMENGPSRTKKPEWANEAAQVIRDTPPEAGGIWGFLRAVLRFQKDQARNYGGYPISPQNPD